MGTGAGGVWDRLSGLAPEGLLVPREPVARPESIWGVPFVLVRCPVESRPLSLFVDEG